MGSISSIGNVYNDCLYCSNSGTIPKSSTNRLIRNKYPFTSNENHGLMSAMYFEVESRTFNDTKTSKSTNNSSFDSLMTQANSVTQLSLMIQRIQKDRTKV